MFWLRISYKLVKLTLNLNFRNDDSPHEYLRDLVIYFYGLAFNIFYIA